MNLILKLCLQVDSLRDSPKRNSRRNGALAPHAKGESSLSSPSFSDSSDSINSVKKSNNSRSNNDHPTTNASNSDANRRLMNNRDDDEFVIKNNDAGSLNSGSSVGGDFSGDITKDNNSGCVSSSSNSIMNKQHINNSDNVDYIKFKLQDNKLASSNSSGGNLPLPQTSSTPSSSSSSSTTAASRSDINNISSPDVCFSVPTSPTFLTTPIIEALSSLKQKESANSVPTSPESGTQDIVLRRNQQQNGTVNRRNDAAGFRTSRSEDHLQHTQRDIMGAVIPIDIDEDVNSSLNTLLDTRQDSEDLQVSVLYISGYKFGIGIKALKQRLTKIHKHTIIPKTEGN